MESLIENYSDNNESEIEIYKTTLNDLFKEERNVYNIDMYQRKYSWEEIQVDELWNDYMKAYKYNAEHYLGVITLVPKENKIYSVVDGQQRLITNMLLLCVLRDLAFQLNYETIAKDIQENFICSKSGIKIEACKIDNDLFTLITDVYSISNMEFREQYKKNNNMLEYLTNSIKKQTGITNSRSLEKIIKNKYKLIYNYKVLQKNVCKELDKCQAVDAKIDIIKQFATLLKNISIIAVVSKNSENIFMLFNSLNNKGMKLSQFDVIRNLFFSLINNKNIDKKNLEEFGEKWDELILILDDIDYIRFLKYFLMCEDKGIISEEKLSEVFKEVYENECIDFQTTEIFLNRLYKYAEIYSTLFKDYEESEYGDAHYYIHFLGQEACYSLLMKCIYDKEKDKKFINKVFSKLESFSLARKLVGKSVKDLDVIFYNLIKQFSEGKNLLNEIDGVTEKIEVVRKLIESDEKEWKNDKMVKYLFKKRNGKETKLIKKIVEDAKYEKNLGNYYAKSEICNISKEDIDSRKNELIEFYINCITINTVQTE